VLRTILASEGPLHLLLLLNDGIADGRDVSWIWDVDYELLLGRAATLVASGNRAADMALRLKYAGLGERLALEENPRAAIGRALSQTPPGQRLYVLPTYTAMLTAREYLAALAGRSRFWKQ
jgi:UDP-N-acetylmuramyl tripeptide synthase